MEIPYKIIYNKSRFPEQQLREDGELGCRGCGAQIPKNRQTWCSRECCNKWHPAFVIDAVRARDKEICVLCGFSLREAEAKWWASKPDYLKEGWAAHSRWNSSKPKLNYDHIIPFSEGGLTIVENIRTLCEDCHKKRTKDWHLERAQKRRPVIQRNLPLELAPT